MSDSSSPTPHLSQHLILFSVSLPFFPTFTIVFPPNPKTKSKRKKKSLAVHTNFADGGSLFFAFFYFAQFGSQFFYIIVFYLNKRPLLFFLGGGLILLNFRLYLRIIFLSNMCDRELLWRFFCFHSITFISNVGDIGFLRGFRLNIPLPLNMGDTSLLLLTLLHRHYFQYGWRVSFSFFFWGGGSLTFFWRVTLMSYDGWQIDNGFIFY